MNRILVEKNETGEVSDRNEEHVIAKWRRVILVRKVAKNWAELCSSALWKVNL